MKKLSLLSLLLCPSLFTQTTQDPASQVNPFIGTAISSQSDTADTSPGATLPFGMLCWGPDAMNAPFYDYNDPVTRGFSLTHLSGPGVGVFGDVPILPILGIPQDSPAVRSTLYQAAYSHTTELAQPGYYAVTLASGIRVELAAALRSGIATFTYPADANPHTILINLSRNLSKISDAHLTIQNRQVTGWVSSGYFSSSENHYRIYFAFEFDATPTSSGTFNEFGVKPGVTSATGPRSGAYLTFNATVTAVHLKVGLSYVSTTNAASNLHQEIPAWDLPRVRASATAAWNAVLNHAQVTGGTNAQRTVFYTALYHAFLHPSTFSDVNGEYLGFDEKVHIAQGRTQYANYSGWDIYRSEAPLIAMLLPDIASDIAQSLIVDAKQGGGCRVGQSPTMKPAIWSAIPPPPSSPASTPLAAAISIPKPPWPPFCAAPTRHSRSLSPLPRTPRPRRLFIQRLHHPHNRI